MNTFYEVQGYYPKRTLTPAEAAKCPSRPPDDLVGWPREWLLWQKCDSLRQARLTYKSGKALIDEEARTCFTSFNKLRIVKVEETRKVVPIR